MKENRRKIRRKKTILSSNRFWHLSGVRTFVMSLSLSVLLLLSSIIAAAFLSFLSLPFHLTQTALAFKASPPLSSSSPSLPSPAPPPYPATSHPASSSLPCPSLSSVSTATANTSTAICTGQNSTVAGNGIPPATSPTTTSSSFSTTVEDTDTLLPQIYQNTINSIVLVRAETDFQNGSALISSGSGFVYDNQGHIVTNNHVIEGASNQVAVNFINGTSYTGMVLGGDNYTDIAVIQINPSILVQEHASALRLADSNLLKIGQHVVAIGNPLEVSGTMTEGIISQLNNMVFPSGASLRSGMIQTDTPFTHGSSGGPLLNLKGQVVGITTQHIVGAPFLAYAIPSGTITRVVPQLIVHGSYSHPWLGIGGVEVTPRIARALGLTDARGIIVTDVIPGSPAATAGISSGTQRVGTYGGYSINSDADVILAADTKKIRGLADLLSYIDTKSVGDKIILSGIRSGKSGLVTVHLTPRPQS